MREIGDGYRGEQDKSDGEQRNRTEVQTKIAPRSEQRRRKQKWRQEEKKNQLWIEMNRRQTVNRAKQQTADDEQNRIGNVELARQHGQNGHGQQKSYKDVSDVRHAV